MVDTALGRNPFLLLPSAEETSFAPRRENASQSLDARCLKGSPFFEVLAYDVGVGFDDSYVGKTADGFEDFA